MAKQKSVVHLPGSKLHQFLHDPAHRPAPEHAEPYPDEYPKIKAVGVKINAMFQYKNIHNDEWPDLIAKIIEMYDEIGWEVAVEIMDARHADGRPVLGSDGFPMRVPSISFVGRSDHKEYEIDHDRMQHNIVNGMADGKRGWIDPNTGELKEDPKRKIIT